MVQLTFFEGLVNASLSLGKVLVSFNIREHSALVDPVVVMRAKEEHREVPQVMLKALDVQRHRLRTANLCRPPSENKNQEGENLTLFFPGWRERRVQLLQHTAIHLPI